MPKTAKAAKETLAALSVLKVQQKLGGLAINAAPLYYPKIYNIQVDPHEDLQVPNYLWAMGPPLKAIAEYEASVKKYPNPPSGNLTDFRGRVGE